LDHDQGDLDRDPFQGVDEEVPYLLPMVQVVWLHRQREPEVALLVELGA